MARVILYTLEGCVHSQRLRAQLDAGEDRVVEVNLSRSPEAMPELLKLTDGKRIVPVLVRDGRIEIAPTGGTEF